MGLRLRDLGSDKLTWADLRAIVRHSPRTSALYRAQHGKNADWGLPELLMAAMVDALRWLVWSKTRDGQKNRNRPKQIPRPGVPGYGETRGPELTKAEQKEIDYLLSLPRKPNVDGVVPT